MQSWQTVEGQTTHLPEVRKLVEGAKSGRTLCLDPVPRRTEGEVMPETYPAWCPACDNWYESRGKLIEHLKKALNEGDRIHVEVINLEDWTEELDG